MCLGKIPKDYVEESVDEPTGLRPITDFSTIACWLKNHEPFYE